MKNSVCSLIIYVVFALLGGGFLQGLQAGEKPPRIVNIVNFIRGVEPREPVDLVQPVREQIQLAKKYGIPSTFLLQYDALINPEFVELLKSELGPKDEIGAWIEVVQPQVEAAGLKWRGRFPWDWHTDVGFTVGYSPEERRKLMDVYMEKFKEVFGRYPKSVGCWIIDAPTLNYLSDKYKIVAACICKDQSGTDGYNLWGGYWNQAYFPSRLNAFMPAQTSAQQLNVPVFRMLGSDPIDQYDTGIGAERQGVITLEPVYPEAGGDPQWVRWFFDVNFKEPCLAFAYTQAGQENSFGWAAMEKGLKDQYPLLADLAKKGEIRLETMAESGEWFRKTFDHTPATAIVAPSDFKGRDRGSVWYESRFYRLNFYSEGDSWRIRDIHHFDEKYPERYLEARVETSDAFFDTLPIIDGYNWSTRDGDLAGIRLVGVKPDGSTEHLETGKPVVKETGKDELEIKIPIKAGGQIEIKCTPENVRFSVSGTMKKWVLEMSWSSEEKTAIQGVEGHKIRYNHNNHVYAANFADASVKKESDSNKIVITPQASSITLSFE
jgi:hypothetical protein